MSRTAVCFVHGDAMDLFRGENGSRFGGAETQVYLLSRMLADNSPFDVRLVSDRDPGDTQYPGMSFRLMRPTTMQRLPAVGALVRRIRARRAFKDLHNAILVQTIAGRHTVHAWEIARRRGFKFVYRMSCDADIDGSILPPVLAGRYLEALKDADGVIAQTEYQQRRLMDEILVSSTVIPNVMTIPENEPEFGGSHVLWVGRCAPIKRPWIFIETARSLPAIQFVMVMPAEDPLFWRSIVQEAESIPNLCIVPGLAYFEMESRFRGAALLASTSAIEGFPNVFLQAAAQGTPIVSLDVDPAGMLNTGGCGVCTEGDVSRFKQTIVDLMSRPEAVRELGTNARQFVQRYHSPDVVRPALTQFLELVASQ